MLSWSPLQVDCFPDLPLIPCKTFGSSERVIVQVLAPSRYDMRLSAYSDVSKFDIFLNEPDGLSCFSKSSKFNFIESAFKLTAFFSV